MSMLQAASGITTIETLACKDTCIHRLMPVSKLITTLFFIIIVVSYGPYEVFALLPYFAYTVWIMLLSELPFLLMFKRIAAALPFVLFLGLANIFLLPKTAWVLNGLPVSYGVLSLVSLLLKAMLTVSAALILAATTRLHELCGALAFLKIPALFINIFMLTYRFIAVLLEEARHMTQAYRLRTGDRRGVRLTHMGMLAGQLLLRSNARAGRVYDAMRLREFNQTVKTQRLDFKNVLYIFSLTAAFTLLRIFDITRAIGGMI